MEFFADIKDVADEEFDIERFSSKVFFNGNLTDAVLVPNSSKAQPYKVAKKESEKTVSVSWSGKSLDLVGLSALSKAQEYSAASAALIASDLGMSDQEILSGLKHITSMPGRMNILSGIKDSVIIDDTYNASPEATILALDTLKKRPEKQKIALLGNMNELGKKSRQYHTEVGKVCDPGWLDLVVTIGPESNTALAEAARQNGCKVITTNRPEEAASAIKKHLGTGAVILAKGSQNGVFAEEAVKQLLADPADQSSLVRQTPDWLAKKSRSFEA
jgi:UDP-N-acetylmuramoyl-tripeptide--D-alanyl-D-alanine ligase